MVLYYCYSFFTCLVTRDRDTPHPPAMLEEKLRKIQRRLSQIAQIPLFIQTALDAMAKVLDEFLLDDEDDAQLKDDDDSGGVHRDDDDAEKAAAAADAVESHVASSFNASDFDTSQADESIQCYDFGELACELLTDNLTMRLSSRTPTPDNIIIDLAEEQRNIELAEQELVKAQKQELISKLDRNWPWKDVEKIIYR